MKMCHDIESLELLSVYNGNVTTDANGEAIVSLPDYAVAINGDFRYQLTVIGQFAQAIVASKIDGASFTISGSSVLRAATLFSDFRERSNE